MNSQITERIKEAEIMVQETKSAYMHAVKHLKELQKVQKQLEYEKIIEKPLIMPNDLISATYCDRRLTTVSEKIWHYALAVYEYTNGNTIPLEVLELLSTSLKQKKFRDAKIGELRNCAIVFPNGLYTKLFSYIEFRDGELFFMFEVHILIRVLACTRAAALSRQGVMRNRTEMSAHRNPEGD